MRFAKFAVAVIALALVAACHEEPPIAQIKASLDEGRNACRANPNLKTSRARADCINAVEEEQMIPLLSGNGLLLQRRVQRKRLELAIQIDAGLISKDVAEATLKEFYAAGAVERNAADSQAEQERLARAVIILGAMRPAPLSPVVNTTCVSTGIITNCNSH